MQWFISKLIDNENEIQKRKMFYEKLTKRTLSPVSAINDFYTFNDSKNDNRCMIIGHTDAAVIIIKLLKERSIKKYKLYLCICSMSNKELYIISKLADDDTIYLADQDDIKIEGRLIKGCEFINTSDSRLDFRATRSELKMYRSKINGFYNKLDSCFTKYTVVI